VSQPQIKLLKHIFYRKAFLILKQGKTSLLTSLCARQGFLKPDQELDVEAYYYPKEIGTHHLNIFFRVLNGKPVILKIKGETLPRRGRIYTK
jgi:hypothetical protein